MWKPESVLIEFSLPSQPGNEVEAMNRVAEAVGDLLPPERLERLKTAVAEATMNAMEHGNRYQADIPAHIIALRTPDRLVVRVTDQGGEAGARPQETPNLDAKLAGMQSPRGWGIFLIEKMVDELRHSTEGDAHILELVMRLEGDHNG
jgi:anti-sigma regulatory factor (Ser/Thr protein kinase)